MEGDNNARYDEQQEEIEALQSIFMDDFELVEERPYKFEITINSNMEGAEKNHLKLKVIFDLPDNYPSTGPVFRIKNLSPDIIDNNKIFQFDNLVRQKIEESLETPMIYEICEVLREQIAEMNEKILAKLDELENKNSINNAFQTFKVSRDAPMNYTPVTKETFAKWCEGYMEKIRKLKEEKRTENDLKPSGRQLFEMRKGLAEIKLDEADLEEDGEEFKDEEGAGEDSEEDEAFYYDKALYAADENEEDVDFD